jgi:spore photoproduct lyase
MSDKQKSTRFSFKEITLDPQMEGTPLGRRIAGQATITTPKPSQLSYRAGKKTLHISGKYGASCHQCSSLSTRYVCCGTHVLRTMSNCPFDCAYCFLQNYLTNGTAMAVADIGALIADVKELTTREPWRFFRIGTWELADSLAFEELLGNTRELIEQFASIPNAVLELRTKSSVIDPILDAHHGGRTIVSFSLNPASVIDREEHGTAPLHERLAAMQKAFEAGYLIALHFDPMIHYPGYEKEYADLVEQIFARIDASRIAWISMGVLRFNPEMRRAMEDNFPRSKLVTAEFVIGPDGKSRYIKPIRVEMFCHHVATIRKFAAPDPLIYLCMETHDVWHKVFGTAPDSIHELDYLIHESLHRRFPEICAAQPELTRYRAIDNFKTR